MAFRLVHAQYERDSQRAYVELREQDADGGELIVTAIFTYRRTNSISQGRARPRHQGEAHDEASFGWMADRGQTPAHAALVPNALSQRLKVIFRQGHSYAGGPPISVSCLGRIERLSRY